ncbi:MAG: YegS/Rv2252/BmrU family lipid kinase [Rikenellaceae bacterium]
MTQRVKKAIFLYNRVSGRATIARQAHKILNIFRGAGYEATSQKITFQPDEADTLFEGRDDLDLVVVAGGDGTVNYIVNIMKSVGVKAALGVIPAGTANDFALALGMNRNPLKAAMQIASGVEEEVDCGYVNGQYFVNIFSFGIFTTTSQRTPNELKQKIGKFAYIVEGFKDIQNLHDIELKIIADEKSFRINSLMVLIFNGSTAGGFSLVRGSSVRDGLLNCLIIENNSLLYTVLALLRFFVGGNPSGMKQIQARNIQILCDDYEPTDADGQRGVDFPLNIECLQGELKMISARVDKTHPTQYPTNLTQ